MNEVVANKTKRIIKLLLCSIVGLFVYFYAFEFNGKNSILIDHMATLIITGLGPLVPYICVAMMICGAIHPFVSKTWNKNISTIIFTIFKILGIPIALMYILKIGPAFLFEPGMLPFLFEKLIKSLTFIIPIGSAMIIFLTDYGLMEFTGVFARPFMRPVYKTPGRSAIDAVASFVGSYSIALIITGNQYKSGYYSKKEAIIIATGFSTVSATFCVIVAKTLNLLDIWNLFFWSTLIITFIVTAITVRLWPISKASEEYNEGVTPILETKAEGNLFKHALNEGLESVSRSTPILKNLYKNFLVGIKITMGLTPSILSVGLVGLILAEYTPLFDIFGYIFYPFTKILGFSDPALVAKAISTSIAEMFLPSAFVVDSDIVTRFVVGVVSISEILFFSASIPCIVSNDIPISFRDIIVIWFWRVVLTLIITTPFAMLIF